MLKGLIYYCCGSVPAVRWADWLRGKDGLTQPVAFRLRVGVYGGEGCGVQWEERRGKVQTDMAEIPMKRLRRDGHSGTRLISIYTQLSAYSR